MLKNSNTPFQTLICLAIIQYFLAVGASHADVCVKPNINVNKDAWQALSQLQVTGVFDGPVRLVDGLFEGAPYSPEGHSRPELRLWPELLASGDLDGLPGDEIVGLLSETSGGSGERVYLFAAMPSQSSYTPLSAKLIGDRVKVLSLTVSDRQISMDVVEAGADQPFCCGTEMNHKVWQLQNHQLVLSASHYKGQLSLQALQGKQWYWLDKRADKQGDSDPGCTLLLVKGDQMIVQTNGRTFSGSIRENQPGLIQISGFHISNLQSPEGQWLNKLTSINQYTFRAGQLLLTGGQPPNSVWLEFTGLDKP